MFDWHKYGPLVRLLREGERRGEDREIESKVRKLNRESAWQLRGYNREFDQSIKNKGGTDREATGCRDSADKRRHCPDPLHSLWPCLTVRGFQWVRENKEFAWPLRGSVHMCTFKRDIWGAHVCTHVCKLFRFPSLHMRVWVFSVNMCMFEGGGLSQPILF